MAPELFAAVTIWLAIGAGAAWLLLSGRRFFFGFPIGLKEGRQMRLFGWSTSRRPCITAARSSWVRTEETH
jgi:hypothetical protein